MATIRNTNSAYGDPVEVSGTTLDEAVAELQDAVRSCGPDFADVEVTDDDYEIQYEVKTDAASETIFAANRDEAAAILAKGEGLEARDEDGLRAELEAMGGWLNIIED